jgi:isopentenyldiphosphate isomerase
MQENELVHVFFGALKSQPKPNPAEVMDVSVVSLAELSTELEQNGDRFAPWLHHYVRHHSDELARGIEGAASLQQRL